MRKLHLRNVYGTILLLAFYCKHETVVTVTVVRSGTLELTRRKYAQSHTHSQTHWSSNNPHSPPPPHFTNFPTKNTTRFPAIRKQHCKNWKRWQKKAQMAHTACLAARCGNIYPAHTHAQNRTLRNRVWMYLRQRTQTNANRGSKAFPLVEGFPFGSAYQIGLVANGGALVGFILSLAGCHPIGSSSVFVVGWDGTNRTRFR